MTHYLDRRFRQVGRIKKAAGTDHKPTIRLLDQMLTGLFERGRLDILRAIQKGEYTPLQVWGFYRIGELHLLPTAATMSPLEASVKDWIADKECSDAHKRSLEQSLRHIMSVGNKSATIADLPELLASLRPKMKAAKHPQSFRLAKAAAQAFVRSRLTKASPLYFQVMAVEGLKVTPQRQKHPLTVAEFNELCNRLIFTSRMIAKSLAHTGMGWSEYKGRWEITGNSVRIYGTKRTGRNRLVPLTFRPVATDRPYKLFRASLALAAKGAGLPPITPYDLRRTYANWLEAAGIPRTRRRIYLGHGTTDVTDLYEWHQVDAFLTEDAELLRRFVCAADMPPLKLEKQA